MAEYDENTLNIILRKHLKGCTRKETNSVLTEKKTDIEKIFFKEKTHLWILLQNSRS